MQKKLLKLGSKEIFYRAVIAAAAFGLLGNLLVTTWSRWMESLTMLNSIIFIASTIAFFGCVIYVIHEFDVLRTGKWHKSWWNKIKHRYRRYKIKIKK